MKLKVIYTGNPVETRVVNADTDEPIEGVDSVEISIDAFGGHCAILLQDFQLEANNLEQVEAVSAEQVEEATSAETA